MQNFHNIEKSGFRHGQYVGYAAGQVYRIKKVGKRWIASNQNGGDSFARDTLTQMSEALEATAAYLLDAA